MHSPAPPPPPAGPPFRSPAPPPASRDELRTLRRWVLVSGVWAVAATAVALIALLDSSDGKAEARAGDAADRVTRLERRQRALGQRLGVMNSRSKNLASRGDVVKLQLRLSQIQTIAAAASKRAARAVKATSEVDDRVKQFEQALGAARLDPAPPDAGADAQP